MNRLQSFALAVLLIVITSTICLVQTAAAAPNTPKWMRPIEESVFSVEKNVSELLKAVEANGHDLSHLENSTAQLLDTVNVLTKGCLDSGKAI